MNSVIFWQAGIGKPYPMLLMVHGGVIPGPDPESIRIDVESKMVAGVLMF